MMSQIFCNILERASLGCIHQISERVQTFVGTCIFGSIALVDALKRYARLHSFCDLKTALMNLQFSLMWELCEIELDHYSAEGTKFIYVLINMKVLLVTVQ